MYRTLFLVVALLALVAPAALAGGFNLAWGTQCYSANPVSVAAFACDTDSPDASWPVTLSFAIDSEMTDMVGLEISLTAQSSSTQLPDWWRLDEEGCRPRAMEFEPNPPAVDEACATWTAGGAMGGGVWNSGEDQYRPGDDPYYGPIVQDPACARIVGVVAIDARFPFEMQPGSEYLACTFTFRNGATIGPGACGGCAQALSIEARQICVAGLGGRRDYLNAALAGGNSVLRWQGREATIPLPARSATWSEVKSLYR